MIRTICTLLSCLALAAACKKEEIRPEEIALQAAKAYYEQLLHGEYEAYVDGTLKGDSVSPAYRQQLVLNMQMYVERQNAEHKGISRVQALRAMYDSSAHTSDAFLAIEFADSTKEEIVVPMVEREGVWYLR